ncbi:hypothetical protein DFH06DRAFT_1148268 [Mycena polygramma]|nr:hypothetical protein DFH06DRAFT_1148268 [Mycena polygramma]
MKLNLSVAAVLQLAIAAGIVHAIPAPAPDDGGSGLVISHIVPVGQYNMTYWVESPGTAAVASGALSARACGTNDVTCSDDHVATTAICTDLIASLNDDTSVKDSPRAICLKQGSDQCCVSWSSGVGAMVERNLFAPADAIKKQCWSPTFGSGLARNVLLNGACVTVCLSNRPNGCS